MSNWNDLGENTRRELRKIALRHFLYEAGDMEEYLSILEKMDDDARLYDLPIWKKSEKVIDLLELVTAAAMDMVEYHKKVLHLLYPNLLLTIRCAIADLEGILPEYDPEVEHPAWKTLDELKDLEIELRVNG
jgi:hypothetical protein